MAKNVRHHTFYFFDVAFEKKNKKTVLSITSWSFRTAFLFLNVKVVMKRKQQQIFSFILCLISTVTDCTKTKMGGSDKFYQQFYPLVIVWILRCGH